MGFDDPQTAVRRMKVIRRMVVKSWPRASDGVLMPTPCDLADLRDLLMCNDEDFNEALDRAIEREKIELGSLGEA